MIKRPIASLLVTICFLFLSGCFNPHLPYFHNSSSEAVTVIIEHTNGYVVEGLMNPNSNMASSHEVQPVSRIEITYDSGEHFVLGYEEIELYRDRFGDPKFEVWFFSKEGIEIGTENDWKEKQKTRTDE